MKSVRMIRRFLILFAFLAAIVIFFNRRQPSQAAAAIDDSKINIFAVLSSEIEEAAKSCSESLLVQEKLKTFPQQGYQIHCTLYMANYSPERVNSLKELVASFALTVRPFDATSSGMFVTKEHWLFLNIVKDRNLQTLSDTIVTLTAPLRSPNQFIPEWAKSSPEKLECIKKYGSPNVFVQFGPHLTLLANADGAALARFLQKNSANPAFGLPVKGRIIGIGLGIADEKGQVQKPIAINFFP